MAQVPFVQFQSRYWLPLDGARHPSHQSVYTVHVRHNSHGEKGHSSDACAEKAVERHAENRDVPAIKKATHGPGEETGPREPVKSWKQRR